jgi:hypothetical protein
MMEVCETTGIDFATANSRNLKRATKKDMLNWMADQWEDYHEAFIAITAKQKVALESAHQQRIVDNST